MKSPPPPPPTPLFRPEALGSVRPPAYGEVVLTQQAHSRWIAWAALLTVVSLILYAIFGTYTRRTTVVGQIVPSAGLIRLTAAQPGVLLEVHAAEGQAVKRGDTLFVVSGDRQGADSEGFQREVGRQIEARQRSLEEDLGRIDRSQALELSQLDRRATSLSSELLRIEQQARQNTARTSGAQDAVDRYARLQRDGYVSRDELLARESALAQIKAEAEGLKREVITIERERSAVQREVESVRNRYLAQESDLKRALLVARQEFTELEARRRIVVSAPADGTVTLVRAATGQSISVGQALAHLVPQGSTLVARLYAPSRAAGFVTSSTRVALRVDAFPHQKFGQQVGQVQTVSTAAATATEINEFAVSPTLAAEPLFDITVALPADGTTNIGTRLPLQAGMKVEGDLLHETRRLYEWALEPLFAARSKV